MEMITGLIDGQSALEDKDDYKLKYLFFLIYIDVSLHYCAFHAWL